VGEGCVGYVWGVIYEWKYEGVVRNFGDALHEFLVPDNKRLQWLLSDKYCYFVIGSVICNEIIRETLDLGYKPVFINCGWRGEQLNPLLAQRCEFVGARGPDTQAELARLGIEVEVTGDPAYRIPEFIEKAPSHGKSIMIPHMKDDFRHSYKAQWFGVDEVVQPFVTDSQSIIDLVETISGADFVFAGAMHAGIIAHAYGVPFSPMSTSFVDCLPKWIDWAKSVDIKNVRFFQNKKEGLEWYEQWVCQ
jgi:hypothetical protein